MVPDCAGEGARATRFSFWDTQNILIRPESGLRFWPR
jgi:hypothetical protein